MNQFDEYRILLVESHDNERINLRDVLKEWLGGYLTEADSLESMERLLSGPSAPS